METPLNVLFFLPLLGGFLFVSTWNYTRWLAHREDKEHRFWYSALAGIASVVVAFALKILVAPLFPCHPGGICLPEFWAEHVRIEHSGVSFSAFLIASLSGFVLNQLPWWRQKEKQSERALAMRGAPLEQFLDRTMREEKLVMITLKGGKVYVGQITSSFVPELPERTIVIWPIWSGYRGSSNQMVCFTTNYEDVYAEIDRDYEQEVRSQLLRDFKLVIPVSEISTARIFSTDIYRKYFANQTAKDWKL